jgi:aminoglycoside/choline kinase family phosphotransferase
MQRFIPARPEDLTSSWLTEALRTAGVISRSSVTDFSTVIIGQEWGFTGIVARVELEYDRAEPDAPASVIAKFPNAAGDAISSFQEIQQRDPAQARRFFERCAREIWFYQQVAPRGNVPAPRMYHGAADLDDGRFVLLLEDLREMNVGDVLLGCSADEAGQVLDAIAPLHANWWDRAADEGLAWIPHWQENADARVRGYQRHVAPFLERFGERTPEPVRAVVERLHHSARAVITELAAAPKTLGHADLHLDNIAFDVSGTATIFDWQTVLWIPAVCDLAAFIVASLDPPSRREHEEDLVRRYHAALVKHGVGGYALDDLWRDYRLALLNILAGNVIWLGSVDLTYVAGRELALVNAAIDDGRLFSAVQDHDLNTLLDS